MRAFHVTALVVTGAAIAFHARAGEPVPAVPLWQAAKDGKVVVRGGSTGSYTEAHVSISNRTDAEISVDVNGSYLLPSGDYQRLGLGLLKHGSSVTEVTVSKGATVKVNVLSVCMDAEKHAPSTGTSFTFVAAPPPRPIETALKKWKKEPTIDQGSIQCNVWSGAEIHPRKREKVPTPTDLPRATHKVAACSGTVYALVGPGELMAAKPGCEFKSVAQDVEDVVACEGGIHALFRAAPAAVSSGTRERRSFVARLDAQGHWGEELTVPKLGHLVWATTGAALVGDGEELVLLAGKPGGRAAARRAVGKAHDQVIAVNGGALVFAPAGEAARITRVLVHDDKAEVDAQELGASFRSVAVWDGVLLGVTARGDLLRVNEDLSLKNMQFLVNVALGSEPVKTRKVRSVRNVPAGVLVELDQGSYVLDADRNLTLFVAPPAGATLLVDCVSRVLLAHKGEELHRLDSAWTQVKFITPPLPDDPEELVVDAAAVATDAVATTSSR